MIAMFCLLTGSVPVWGNVFGDGNPDNGTEDGRESWLARSAEPELAARVLPQAGTIRCDGAVRGSATLVHNRHMIDESRPSGVQGHLIATAAHVLVDLDTGRPYSRCHFHYLGLIGAVDARQVIQRRHALQGAFQADQDPSDTAAGKGDWVFVYLPNHRPGWPDGLPVADLATLRSQAGETPLRFHLVAWDSDREVISLSRNCRVMPGRADNLAGDTWIGQGLDDCDSGHGASGGGLLASLGSEVYVVGIRSGAHWSAGDWPPGRYPLGPPDGSPWDPSSNTNFFRALDADILEAFRDWSQTLR